MDWFIPITILPGVGMIIMSTTTQMMFVSGEIADLLKKGCTEFQHMISDQKIKQLGRLTRATAFLYVAAACLVLSGIYGNVASQFDLIDIATPILYAAVLSLLWALLLLIRYSFKAIEIRQLQHDHTHPSNKNASDV